MNQSKIHDFLIQNVSALEGVGAKTKKLLKKKRIEKKSDLMWNLPQGFTDRSKLQKLDKQIATQQQTSGASQNKSTSSTNLEFLCGASETGEMSAAYVYVYNAGDSAKYTYSTTQSMMTSTLRSQFGGGLLPQTSTVDGFRIESTGETTLNGTISLYGIRYS